MGISFDHDCFSGSSGIFLVSGNHGKRFMKLNEAGHRFKISQQKFFIVTDNACPNFHILNRARAEKADEEFLFFVDRHL